MVKVIGVKIDRVDGVRMMALSSEKTVEKCEIQSIGDTKDGRSTLPISARFKTTHALPPTPESIQVGPYTFKPMDAKGGSTQEIEVRFNSTEISDDPLSWNPDEELSALVDVMSLAMNSPLGRVESTIAEQRFTTVRQFPFRVESSCMLDNAGCLVRGILLANHQRAPSLLRASHIYRLALDCAGIDSSLTFFLLTVAIEALANEPEVVKRCGKAKNYCDKYCNFVLSFFPDECRTQDERNVDIFKHRLKTIYKDHRSAFTHSGREISGASALADKLGLGAVLNFQHGNAVTTPGLLWFFNIVRLTLLGYFNSLAIPTSTHSDSSFIRRFLREKSVVNMKVNKPIAKGAAVSRHDVYLH